MSQFIQLDTPDIEGFQTSFGDCFKVKCDAVITVMATSYQISGMPEARYTVQIFTPSPNLGTFYVGQDEGYDTLEEACDAANKLVARLERCK